MDTVGLNGGPINKWWNCPRCHWRIEIPVDHRCIDNHVYRGELIADNPEWCKIVDLGTDAKSTYEQRVPGSR